MLIQFRVKLLFIQYILLEIGDSELFLIRNRELVLQRIIIFLLIYNIQFEKYRNDNWRILLHKLLHHKPLSLLNELLSID